MNAPDRLAAARALAAWWESAGVDAGWELSPPRAGAAAQPPPAARLAAPPATAGTVRAADSAISAAKDSAAACATVEQWIAAVEAFDGGPLKQTAKSTVTLDGAREAEILLIGEAPGKEEDETGRPFLGRSGRLLDRMLGSIGLSRQENVLIAHAVFWRPPGDRPPRPPEIAMCLPFVERLIALQRPKLLILCGLTAAKALLRRNDPLSRLRRRRLSWSPEAEQAPNPEQAKVNALVILPPDYLLHRPQEKRLAWEDLRMLEAWAEQLNIARAPTP